MAFFRTTFNISRMAFPIGLNAKIYATGSCFAENIAQKIAELRLPIVCNPFGIIFNPLSIAKSLNNHLNNTTFKQEELFLSEDLYRHFDAHSRLAHPDAKQALHLINTANRTGAEQLKQATHLIVTFGTAFVYEHNTTKQIVANNHKLPATLFTKKLLSVEQIVTCWETLLNDILVINPNLIVVFTISPVRHWRDGVVENNLSKSILIQAVHQLTNNSTQRFYFPAYELMMDDLRDYRFYSNDMLHPNTMAIDYIWNAFIETCSDSALQLCKSELDPLMIATQHKSAFPDTATHQKFKASMLLKVQQFKAKWPMLPIDDLVQHFSED
jgi:hypothetical protein